MKTPHFLNSGPPASQSPREQGFALVVVFLLLAIIASLSVSNTAALRRLKREIALVERQQIKKYPASKNNLSRATAPASPNSGTNAGPALPGIHPASPKDKAN